ncbi:Uncharacterised protein [Listeria monocytogenes]|nr:Uncharacterised protein [Listeria monocytogenes]CWX17958.1 Uncharacterised protein [Listeria monocytogenes]
MVFHSHYQKTAQIYYKQKWIYYIRKNNQNIKENINEKQK